MEYWQLTDEIKKNYKQLIEKQNEYGRLFREFIVQETCFKEDEITECLLHEFGFKLKNYYSDELLKQNGLKRSNKTQIITPFVKTEKGKTLKKKFNKIVFPKINSLRILEIFPHAMPFFVKYEFQKINNEIVCITDTDLSEYGCIKKEI